MAFPVANMTCSCTITPASSAHRRGLQQESRSITDSASRSLQVCVYGVLGAGRSRRQVGDDLTSNITGSASDVRGGGQPGRVGGVVRPVREDQEGGACMHLANMLLLHVQCTPGDSPHLAFLPV